MKMTLAILGATFLLGASIWQGSAIENRLQNSNPAVRIGTYDNRAIAIAWASSKYNPVGEKVKELEAAKKANDTKKIAELEAWGPAHQRLLHFQGFGRVPVSELLEPVQPKIQELMKERGLSAVAMQCDALAEGVETVDLTMDLVKLFDPNEKTLDWAEQVKAHDPLSLIELAKMDDDK